jgi:fructoselysine and glucoselysine-specific PTS system IIB component
MIKLLRVDHRLLHGQVAFAWTGYLDADCILIANDDVVADDLKKTTMKLARPNGVKLVIKSIDDSIAAINEGKTDKYKLFIVVDSVKDAARLGKSVAEITKINIGGLMPKKDSRFITRNINFTPEDEAMLKELIEKGVQIELRTVPGEAVKYYKG